MLKVFRLTPITRADAARRLLMENPEVLGRGWQLAGNSAARAGEELVLLTPAGDLVLCLVAVRVDCALLTRGLTTLGRLRQALPLVPLLVGDRVRKQGKARLLLLGGRLERPVLEAAGPGIGIKLLGVVPDQPGPPLLVYDPPLERGEETFPGAAAGGEGEESPFHLGDGEIGRILSDHDLEVEHGGENRR